MIDFDQRPHDEQIALLEETAIEAARNYDFGDHGLRLLNFRENAVFAVDVAGAPVGVIRVHRHGYRSQEELQSELLWMQALQTAGIRTPPVIKSSNGSDIVRVIGRNGQPSRFCTALGWVAGAPPVTDMAESFATLGRLSAEIHNHAQNWHRPSWFTRPMLDEDSIFGVNGVWGNFTDLEVLTPEQRTLLTTAADAVRERLSHFPKTSSSWGLVHGDLMPENILVDAEGIRVIDFDDSGFSWFLNDLATAVTMHLGTVDFDALCANWIGGYREVRELPDEHLQYLPDLIMARLLQFLGWGHTRRYSETAIALTQTVVEGACHFADHLLAEQS